MKVLKTKIKAATFLPKITGSNNYLTFIENSSIFCQIAMSKINVRVYYGLWAKCNHL